MNFILKKLIIVLVLVINNQKVFANDRNFKTIDSLIASENFTDADKILVKSIINEKNVSYRKMLLTRKAAILFKQNRIIEALEIIHKNIDYFNKKNNISELKKLFNILGSIYLEYNHLELAELNYKKALNFNSKNNNTIILNLLSIYSETKNEKLFNYYSQILEKNSEFKKNKLSNFRLNVHKSILLYNLNKIDTHEYNDNLEVLKKLKNEIKNPNLDRYYNVMLSIYNNKHGNNQKALTLINKAYEELNEEGLEYSLIFVLKIKSKILMDLKKYDEQLETQALINNISVLRNEKLIKKMLLNFENYIQKKNENEKLLIEKESIAKRNTSYLLIILSITLVLVSMFLVFFIKLKKKENEIKNKNLEKLKAVIETEENERNRIANEIHDGLGGLLSVIRLKSSKENEEIKTLIDKIIFETKTISNSLTFEYIKKQKLEDVIKDFINLTNSDKLKIHFQSVNFEEINDYTLNITIYRIIQELINNIIKHSQATKAIVQLTKFQNIIQITVEDNGIGFKKEETNNSKGIGFSSIKKRINLFNGSLNIESEPNKGTSIYIELKI